MQVVVTGTSGRLGRAIVEQLSSEHTIVGVDRVPGAATQVVADIGDSRAMASVLRGADALIHAAALHAPHVGQYPDAEFYRINVDATYTIACLAREAGVRKLVFTSTTALYGGASRRVGAAAWLDESAVPQPLTVYHRTKLAAESRLETLAGDDFGITVLRMSRCFPESAPLMACYRLHRGVDARDVASAHEAALAGHSGFARFIVSAATPFQRTDGPALDRCAEQVIRIRCPAMAAEFDRRRWELPLAIDRVYDASAARVALGWRPRFGWEAVLQQLDAGSDVVLPP